MFISKKHLSRRAVLRGLSASVALPLLDAMVPAHTALAQTAAAPTQRFSLIYVPHGVIMEAWMPKTVGTNYEMPAILQPLAGLREHFNVITGLYSEGANAHSACPGFYLRVRARAARQPDPAQHVDRPGDRAEDRSGHHVPVDGARDRRQLEHLRHVRRRLPVHVHGHDLVAHADAAAADGDEPTRRVRAHVRRRRRERRGAPRAARPEHEHLGRRGRGRAAASRRAWTRAIAPARRVPLERSRGGAPHHASRGAAHAAQPRSARDAKRHAGILRRAREADVRAPGARVPGRPHSRDVAS